ncbi:hypothetical protein B5C34_15400 [Pacificimonas flava]|uniref:FAD:protein FMN transferase n=2 Tax=Pacificimonas TaxID=1960290 RepID=A0A219B104_9SPHN|nr:MULTISPECIES: FAD:protein FMN transferase [Pacificimonas]MBZ6379650.1 FAD:protein FMN transferase [Pacificimonas aurantium]OWV31884.1 hypothetical protein B5C34_15400 [Pacificimonas flava]
MLIPDPPESADLRPLAGDVLRLTGETMGTYWRASVVAAGADADRIGRTVAGACDEVIRQMSQWDPASELSRFNHAPGGVEMSISPGFAHVLDCALTIQDRSGGAFDPLLGDASEAWGFGVAAPPETIEEQACEGRETSSMPFDAAARKLTQPGGSLLDLSAIAKGFAVDLCLARLVAAGWDNALVEIGGELAGRGVKPNGLPWWVDIEGPPGLPVPPARIALCGWAVATSGDWHRRREAEGQSWSHTLDPAMRRPLAQASRAATVLHPSCMQADGLATALMVLDPGQALAFADRYGLPARIVDRHGQVLRSERWAAMARPEEQLERKASA